MTEQAVTFEVEGLKELQEGIEEMANYFGANLVGRRAILPALREAGRIIQAAQQDLAPVDTGVLRDSIKVSARPTTENDKKSKYYQGETAAVFVGPRTRGANIPPGRKTQMGDQILAMEFGTAEVAAHPFIRTSLELRGMGAVGVLRVRLQEELDKLTKRIYREGRRRGKMFAKYGGFM